MMLCAILGLSFPATAKDFVYIPCANALQIIDCETDTVVKTVPYNDYIANAAFSPDGKYYYLTGYESVYVIDTKGDRLADTYNLSSELSRVKVFGLAVSNDGTQLYLSSSIVKKKQNIPKLDVLPPQLVVYDIKNRKMVKNYEIPCSFSGIVTLRNDPENLIIVGLDIHKLNLKSGKLEMLLGMLHPEAGGEPKNGLVLWQNNYPGDHGLFANPYYTASGMGYFIVDKNTGKVSTLKGKDVWFEYSNVISPDKKYLYGVMDELIKIDMNTGETVKSVPLKQGTCYALTLTSDGKKIYVGPAGPDVSVYNTETLELMGVIPLAGDGVVAHLLVK